MDSWAPPKAEYESDHFLLNNIDQNFDLDFVNFLSSDVLDPASKAYPPLDPFQNTPSLLPQKKGQPAESKPQEQPNRQKSEYFQSPILPGQNDRSYNIEHLYHKQKQQRHVRPDALYTPLVSPAVTPSEKNAGAALASFEPLTLPALNAQRPPLDRRRPLLATFSEEQGNPKRRTPHTTPNLQAKTRRSPSLRKLPQAHDLLENSDATMLPPLGKVVPIENDLATPENLPLGPATLMGFTMNRLAELQSNTDTSPSPALGPRRDLRNSISKALVKRETLLLELSPVLEPQHTGLSSISSKREKPHAKKASHKIAEQGRRNRMNQAVHDLLALIPQSYHEQVSVPSKATTVELASSYIQHLTDEVARLKAQLQSQ